MLDYAPVILAVLSLPVVFTLMLCAIAWALSRNEPDLRRRLFDKILTLISRGPRTTEIALRVVESYLQSHQRDEITTGGTRSTRSRDDRAA
jgi:hypothetical protein